MLSLMGGPPITLCDARVFQGGDWGSDGTIVFTALAETGVGLYRISATGGEPESLAHPDLPNQGRIEYHSPQILPGGKDVLFTIVGGDTDFQIAVLSLETGEKKTLILGGRTAYYSPTGHLVYERAGTLMAVGFDLAKLETTGDSVPILQGVRQVGTAGADYALSDEGTLVYVRGEQLDENKRVVWMDRDGKKTLLTEDQGDYSSPRLSPEGDRVALRIGDVESHIWIYQVTRDTLTRLTFEGRHVAPVWTPDGTRVTFGSGGGSNPGGLSWAPADGSGMVEQLLESGRPGSWSPDGQVLAFTDFSINGSGDIRLLPIADGKVAQPFLTTPFNEGGAVFSPDGRYLAYVSDESGRFEIYLRLYPGPGGKTQISTEGGTQPVWARSGEELFYRNGDQMMTVAIATEPELRIGKAQSIFEVPSDSLQWYRPDYDVTPDGQRFLMIERDQESTPTQIHVVLNWFEELKRLVPTP